MCLAIPGKVTSIDRNSIPTMGIVSFAGVSRPVCLDWLPEIQIGEYVIVHVGFAISKVDENDALETLRLLEQMGEIEPQTGEDSPPPDPGTA
jgi:hydrogenase expression/formation protein HypC